MLSKSKEGSEFEKRVAAALNCKRTARSGAHWDDADLRPNNGARILIETKVKNTVESFSVTKRQLNKLIAQANKHGADWLFVMKDGKGREYVLCSLDFFTDITPETFS